MTIIAMTREMGSLGRDVARGLAAELGLRLLYHEIVDNLAEKMHLPSSVVTRFLQGNAGLIATLRNDLDALSLYTAEEVLDIAAGGNLMIRGWGATCLLRPVSHVVCVRVCAPLELRAERIMARLNLTDRNTALHEVKHSDAAHAAAMHRRFGIDCQDPMHYDIVLNTERVSVADCIDQITEVSKRPAFQETAASRAKLLHLALSAHVQATLHKDRRTASIRISIGAPRSGNSGEIVLSGIVVNDDERRHAQAVAAQCPGVHSIDNQLRLMSDSGRLRKMENG